MTDDQSQELKVRLLRHCKFEPTIAEIMDEWKAMQRRPHETYRQEPVSRQFDPAVARALRETQKALKNGTYRWEPVITPVLVAFARHWIPDITEAEIKENVTEIEQAQREMKDDYAQKRPYVTGLIRHGGMIVTCMKRVS